MGSREKVIIVFSETFEDDFALWPSVIVVSHHQRNRNLFWMTDRFSFFCILHIVLLLLLLLHSHDFVLFLLLFRTLPFHPSLLLRLLLLRLPLSFPLLWLMGSSF